MQDLGVFPLEIKTLFLMGKIVLLRKKKHKIYKYLWEVLLMQLKFKKILINLIFSSILAAAFSISIFADGSAIAADTKETTEPVIKAAVLMEASTGQMIYEKEAKTPLPVGTLNKIMTSLLVVESLENGKFSLDTQVAASSKASSMKQAVIWLKAGEKMTVDDLLKGMIIGNANDAAVVLAEAIAGSEESFVGLMNARAKELGMENTAFANCTGYDVEGQGSTAYDIALLCREVVKHESLHGYMTCWMDTLRNGETEVVNANTLVKNLKGVIGIKAGTTEAAGNCLAVAANRDGITYIAVILGGADKDSRFIEGKRLINSGFANYMVEVPVVPENVLAPIKVRGGVKGALDVGTDYISGVVVPNGGFEEVITEFEIPVEIEAPISKNQVIGKIIFIRNDKTLSEANIIALEDIEDMTMLRAFGILSQNLLKL